MARLTDGATSDGLDRLLDPESLRVPATAWLQEVDGEESICWEWWSADDEWEIGLRSVATEHDRGVLDAFGRLTVGDADEYLAFTLRWGPMELCDHLLPWVHPPVGDDACAPLGGHSDQHCPLWVWRVYARQVQAAMDVAASLYRRGAGGVVPHSSWEILLHARHTWRELNGHPVFPESPRWIGDVEAERFFLAYRLDEWIEECGLRPIYRWETGVDRPGLHLGGGGVWGAVLRQLLLVVARLDGLAVCSGCARAFVPTRRPAVGRRAWCPTCGKKAADREAQRRRRARGG